MNSVQIYLLTILGGIVSVVTAAIKLALPERYHHLLPLVPLALGALGGAVSGFTPGVTAGERILYGVLAGAFSGQAYESIKKQLPKTEDK